MSRYSGVPAGAFGRTVEQDACLPDDAVGPSGVVPARSASALSRSPAPSTTDRPTRRRTAASEAEKSTLWVLGDQLHRTSGVLRNADPSRHRILFVTSLRSIRSKRWHRQRLHIVLAGMAKLAAQLRDEGFDVDERVSATLLCGWEEHCVEFAPTATALMHPNSWSGAERVKGRGVELLPNDQFLCTPTEFATWAATRTKQIRMEDFYRWQRQRLGILIEPDGTPAGGSWNYDDQNRERPPKDGRTWPEPERFELDEIDRRVASFIDSHAPHAFGAPYDGLWPTTTAQAEARLDRVIAGVLPMFGPHEDAMLHGNWHLAHTLLSSALNLGMLNPATVIERAVDAYRRGAVPLSSAEGFIRQIIGWREYVWGLYWLWMPDYAAQNALGAVRPIPPAFVGAPTNMRCVSRCVEDLESRGYLHHIQRLMVLGNLSLLAGVDPKALTDWMWAGFVDAAEWVMVPNVIGMSQHADGGRMATKPYASGGAYISKMSDYCTGCSYDPKKRVGSNACPFTTLYWDFLARHDERFRRNHRMSKPLAGMRRLSDLEAVRERAASVLHALDEGTL